MNKILALMLAAMMAISANAAYYNQTTQQIATYLPTKLASETGVIIRPTDAQLEAAGWVVTPIVNEALPVGMVRMELTNLVVLAGVPTRQFAYMTQAAYDAQQAAEEAAAEQALATHDAQQYGASLADLATALGKFSTDFTGMDYPAIRVAAKAEIDATADFASYKVLDMALTEAKDIFERQLEEEGVTGARLWRAIAVILAP